MADDFFEEIRPAVGTDVELDWNGAQEIPQKVLDRFAEKQYPMRALGIALRRVHGQGRYAIRYRDGKTWVVPRL